MKTTRVFSNLVRAWESDKRYIVSKGGTRSSKTYSALQLLIVVACYSVKPLLISVVSETLPHLKKGAIRDFKSIMAEAGIWEDARWHDTDKIYTFHNGSQIEFFSADSPGKVHGPGRDILFINEAQNMKWETVRHLNIRTKGKVMFDYNPTSDFWVDTEILSGDRYCLVHSTYKDNRFLSAEQVADIESNMKDENWWRVYGLGLTGRLEGLIYDFTQIDEMPDRTGLVQLYGLDFGFTNDPTALLDILVDTRRKIVYADELLYRRRMLNSDIIGEMDGFGIRKKGPEIFADSAEPKSIEEISQAGYNCKPCFKGQIRTQLNTIKQYDLRFTKRSLNLIREGRNYQWKMDKDGNPTNEPCEGNDHAMDALRYGIFTKFGEFKRPITGGKAKSHKAW